MTHKAYHERLQKLRTILAKNNIDGFIITVADEFCSEYPPAYYRRLEWLTGFSGSAGTAIILDNNAAFFTDGRYMLQAANELSPDDYKIFNIFDLKPWQWLHEHADKKIIGIDHWLVSQQQLEQWQKHTDNFAIKLLPDNPVDIIWPASERQKLSAASAFYHDLQYSGRSHQDKITQITQFIKKQKADALLLTNPESVCWLLNIRGHDIEYSPILLCRAILYANSHITIFVPKNKITQQLAAQFADITIKSPHEITTECTTLVKSHCKILADKTTTPAAISQIISNNAIYITDPCINAKACKNDIELANIAQTHITDGAAVTKFINWLQDNCNNNGSNNGSKPLINELSAAAKLEKFRQESPLFLYPSFPTISGFAANGAIIHYRANDSSNIPLAGNSLYLVDSGGQYLGGTTDITRTIAIGVPTYEMKRAFTLVLKGHIALANAIFPKNTTGSQLDILARQHLWQQGLDYDHGTGHGVGCFMNVHEGPQTISKRPNSTPLQAGMILSNEPGYYLEGQFGIRIENLILVTSADIVQHRKFGFSIYDNDDTPDIPDNYMYFRTLTCAPIDTSLVIRSMLTKEEQQWIDSYHKWVKQQLNSLNK